MANICWVTEKQREFQKNIYFCFIDYAKDFVWITTNCRILKEIRIPDHLTCLLRNLYAGQETRVIIRHVTVDWFQTGKGVFQGCIFPSFLFKVHIESIMQNDSLDEVQVGIMIAQINIYNLRYADDTTLWQKAKKN